MKIAEQAISDTDIHNTIPSLETLYPYLPDFWCDYIDESVFVAPDATDYPAGSPPGSDLNLLREQTLAAWNAEFGILTCDYWTSCVHHEDFALSLSSAINDWQVLASTSVRVLRFAGQTFILTDRLWNPHLI